MSSYIVSEFYVLTHVPENADSDNTGHGFEKTGLVLHYMMNGQVSRGWACDD